MRHSKLMVLVALAVAAVMIVVAQDKPLSPPGTAEYAFADGKKVTIAYHRPSMRGRKIVGGLVPYGQVWRTGANEATSLVTTANLSIGGTAVPAGKYTIYSLPSESGWKLIVNQQTGQWGTEYNEKQDLARIDMQKSATSAPVEQFTISFDKKDGKTAALKLTWENTEASVNVSEK